MAKGEITVEQKLVVPGESTEDSCLLREPRMA